MIDRSSLRNRDRPCRRLPSSSLSQHPDRDAALASPLSEAPQPTMHSVSGEDSKASKRRGPVSCAECRRLKLKCDRRLPCTSCSKRGCAAICPNGTLAAGPGNRFVLADTQHLHDKIDSMAKRIAELEDGLASLVPPGEVHPLLADDLLRIKALPNTENVAAAIQQQQEGGTDGTGLAEFFGTLKIGDRPQFFGPTAAADYLTERPRQPTPDSSLPLDLLLLSSSFPLAQLHDARADIQRRLGEWLPRRSEARALLDTYYADGDWMFRVIPREELESTIFDRVYAGGSSPEADASVDDVGHASSPESNMSHHSPSEFADSTAVTAHELAVLFMILAHGYHFDTARPPYNSEGHISYQLARVALGLDPVDEHPTISAIRALHLMATFVQFADAPHSGTVCYVLIGLAAQLARSLGMHRDDSRWTLNPAEQQARRNIFWDVVTFEYWCALSFGRPSSWSPSQVDAKLPEDVDRIMTEDGVGQMSFRLWAMSFTQTRMMKVMDQAFGITPLTYATVMRLDKYIKEQPVSDFVRLVHIGRDETTTYTTHQMLQRYLCFCMTHKLLLYLHRAYLAQAIIDCPDDPLKSRYAGSVLSAYRSAIYISASVRSLRLQVPLCIKTWAFWTYAYSSFVVLCSIVIRSATCGLAPPAMKELELLHAVFDSVRTVSRRVDGLMPTMTSLLQKARAVYAHHEAAGALRMPCTEIEAMGIGFLWGHTRTIEQAPDGAVLSVTGSSPFTKMTPMTNEVTPDGQSFYDGVNGGGPAYKAAGCGSTSGSSACGSMSPPSLTVPAPSPPTLQANLSIHSPRGGAAGSGKLRTQRSMDLDPQQQQQQKQRQQRLLRTPNSMDYDPTPTTPAPVQQPYLRPQASHEFNQPLLSTQPSLEFDHPLLHSHPSMDSRHSSPGMQPSNVALDAPGSTLLPSGGSPFGGVFEFQNPTWFQPGQANETSHSQADPYVYPLQPANQSHTSPYSHPSVQVQPPPPTSSWPTQPAQQQQQQYGAYLDPAQQRQQHFPVQLHPHHQQQQPSKRFYEGLGGQQGQNQPPPLPAALDTTWDRFVEGFSSPSGMYTGTVPHG